MEKFIICGGIPLNGDVAISGMKNSALPIIFGTILTKGTCTISNLPDISDVKDSLAILQSIGASVRFIDTNTAIIDTSGVVTDKTPPLELVSKIRASYYLWGTMLGRFNQALVGHPGGCDFGGGRPIAQHLKSLAMLGAKYSYESNAAISLTAPNGLKGASIYLDIASVGTTINVMYAAAVADGVTVIENAAREPHIVDTACFLNACGAKIMGAGTTTIRITGVKKLKGCSYSIAPDMIEAGTYMIAGAITGGKVRVTNVIPKHLDYITRKLTEANVPIEIGDSHITVGPVSELKGTPIKANPYPGFPTDMQPQFSALMTLAKGVSDISDGIYSSRYKYTDHLINMGAKITKDAEKGSLTIFGVSELTGATVKAPDLRGGAALILAGLAAKGITTVTNIVLVERGYDHIIEKLRSLGANIKREKI
jgi:UDP-N-acetylglucosamine 1-carboxyvinyltransferase